MEKETGVNFALQPEDILNIKKVQKTLPEIEISG